MPKQNKNNDVSGAVTVKPKKIDPEKDKEKHYQNARKEETRRAESIRK